MTALKLELPLRRRQAVLDKANGALFMIAIRWGARDFVVGCGWLLLGLS